MFYKAFEFKLVERKRKEEREGGRKQLKFLSSRLFICKIEIIFIPNSCFKD